ncbi:MAG: hypothetical protein JWP97_3687 [Labilithrix sp.]|nr:hypothetical protein [Labilithrix sp.]
MFAVVSVLALGSAVVTKGIGGGAEQRLAQRRAEMRAECMDLGASGASSTRGTPCDPGEAIKLMPAMRQAREELESADRSLRSGDRLAAAARLARVLAAADNVDRRASLVGAAAAAQLIAEVASRVDLEPSLLDRPELAQAVRRTAFLSARHPLAPERLAAMASLAAVPGQMPLRTGGIVEGRVADAMGDVDGTLRTMERALLARDTRSCEAAVRAASGYARHLTVGPDLCRVGERIVASGDRLARLRARADAHDENGRRSVQL